MGSPKDEIEIDVNDPAALGLMLSLVNRLKKRLEDLEGRENTGSVAQRVRLLEDQAVVAADLFADAQLSCFRTDKLDQVKQIKAGAAEILKRREDDAQQR